MPPGKRTGPVAAPGPRTTNIISSHSVAAASVNTAALRRLVELHWRGWLTRGELETAFGLPYEWLADAARCLS